MANLKELELDYHWIGNEWNSPKFDDLLTLNVENCTIHKTQFALRDLNRFFKMWTKGSFPKLQSLFILGRSEKDCDILLKGLNAEEAEDSQRLRGDKKFIIKNSGGVRAQMRVEIFGRPVAFHISFAVSK
ncbi:hypothetical protein B9Z55_011233 [Caenorhabditis nigoni]|uniref:Sdz-33 F-box domain-containing protein n=1 Tax=Caenorhabditis nigoni TaxID=1611254 RepID=A0A2G5UJ80_9PELO|nr:hypothetical protein B9Z55_011233 [Caenorhabditis nigoni]